MKDLNAQLNVFIFIFSALSAFLKWNRYPLIHWWDPIVTFFLYLVACHLVKHALSRLGIVQALDTQEMKLRQLLRGLLAKFKSR